MSVYIYNYVCTKKFVLKRTRDLFYFKFVDTDFFQKIIRPPVLVKTPVTQHSPCYSAVSALLTNPLPDRSNYSPLCHTHYLTPNQYFTITVSSGEPFTNPLRWRLILHCCSALLLNLVGNSEKRSALRKLNNKQRLV